LYFVKFCTFESILAVQYTLGLLDGIFPNQSSQFGQIILERLAIGDVSIFNGHLVYFTDFWYILLPFGIFLSNLVYVFPPSFGMLCQEKSGNPGTHA
jgi:hypothetical protein